jgi:cAMP-dependent protein kinase regulator
MSGQQKEYIEKTLNPFLKEMLQPVIIKKPEDPVSFMIDWLHKKLGHASKLSEKEELRLLRQEVARLKSHKPVGSEGESSESNSSDEVDDIDFKVKPNPERHRSAVSAEAYGTWNKKSDFKPREIPKSDEQTSRLLSRLNSSFIFETLDEKDKSIVIHAMEEKKFAAGETVIRQGDDGKELFVVGSGHLKCFKRIGQSEKMVKEYDAGDSFGELALFYNAPRAATIVADTDCELWSLDRECFNHIVKDAAVKKRERYEEFLSRVDLLKMMDPYERSQLADVLKPSVFSDGELVIREGEEGNVFFIIEEGTAIALKSIQGHSAPVEVKKYFSGDYFGELALVRNTPRAASIQATSQLKCLSLDRHSFKRLLGPVETILQRNAEKYEEVNEKLTT